MAFQVSFVVNCTAVYIYLILNREPLQTILSRAEEVFSRCINHLALNRMSLYGTVMADVYRQNTILTRTVLTTDFTAYLFWTIFPFVLWCIKSETDTQDIENSEEIQNYNNGQWKYFCYRMWLPQNATQTPLYQIIYVYQALENSMVILIYTVHNLVTSSLLLHITSQFKALTTCLERIAEMPLALKEFASSVDEASSDNLCESATRNRREWTWRHGNKEDITERNKLSFGHARRYEMLQHEQSDRQPGMDKLGMLYAPNEDDFHCYLVNCVKFHQFLLQ
jgi:hypothetical protein